MKLRSIIVGAVAATLLVGPVYAQRTPRGSATEPKPEEIEKKKNAEALDRQYRRALEGASTNSEPVKIDPWQNMRGPDDSKTKK